MKRLQAKLLWIDIFVPRGTAAKKQKLLAKTIRPLRLDRGERWRARASKARSAKLPGAEIGQLRTRPQRRPLEKQKLRESAVLRQARIGSGEKGPLVQRLEISHFGRQIARAGEVTLGQSSSEAPGDDGVVAVIRRWLIAIRRWSD